MDKLTRVDKNEVVYEFDVRGHKIKIEAILGEVPIDYLECLCDITLVESVSQDLSKPINPDAIKEEHIADIEETLSDLEENDSEDIEFSPIYYYADCLTDKDAEGAILIGYVLIDRSFHEYSGSPSNIIYDLNAIYHHNLIIWDEIRLYIDDKLIAEDYRDVCDYNYGYGYETISQALDFIIENIDDMVGTISEEGEEDYDLEDSYGEIAEWYYNLPESVKQLDDLSGFLWEISEKVENLNREYNID